MVSSTETQLLVFDFDAGKFSDELLLGITSLLGAVEFPLSYMSKTTI